MITSNLKRFLSVASKHTTLIIDLCTERDVISRSKLLNYLEQHRIAAADKAALIEELCKVHVLDVEAEQSYTVNPVVSKLVDYYERRGRLTSAKFLRDRVIIIARLTDDLQRLLFAEEKSTEELFDKVDELYRLVREVREAGDEHYMACMRLFGDMKRTSGTKTVEQRIGELRTAQRRHINPLRELIDPGAEYARKIEALRRRLSELSSLAELLAGSLELDGQRRRLIVDLQYIDHVLLRDFGIIERTALTLLQSLLEEKRIKDAVAACLGDLESTWEYLDATTVVATGHQASQSPSPDSMGEFFIDVIHSRLLPNPTPLSMPAVQRQSTEQFLIREEHIWRSIESEGKVTSWPTFVVHHFTRFPGREQLRAIALPLSVPHARVQIRGLDGDFTHQFDAFGVRMHDFGLTWEAA